MRGRVVARALGLAIAFAALASAGVARGDEAEGAWAVTFNPMSIASVLPAGAWAVAVIDGSANTEAAAGAREAVLAGLRSSGRTRLVIDGSATLGDVSLAEDHAVVSRAGFLPVDVIAIVRARATGGVDPIGAIAFYTRAGQPLGQVIGRRGARGVRDVLPGQPLHDADDQAVDRAARRLVSFRFPDAASLGRARPVIGLHPAVPISPGDLYALVGRRDLAARDRHARAVRITLVVAGALVCGAGFTAMVATDYSRPGLIGGGVVFGVGLAPLITGIAWNVDPVPFEEARRLTEEYNRGVRSRMDTSERERPLVEGLTVAPWFVAGGGGLGAQLAF